MKDTSFSRKVKNELRQVATTANHCRAAQHGAAALFTSGAKAYNIVKVPKRRCCKRAFLREAFLQAGSMSDPGKGYHLEFACADEEISHMLQETLASFDIRTQTTKRAHHIAVYIKDSNAIAEVLNIMGAHVSLMEMENQRILRGMRGEVNRRVNCDAHNIVRTVRAAATQTDAIRYLQETGKLKTLPAPLQQAAKARLKAPEMPLSELAAQMKPALTKSGLNHRLQKIVEIALRAQEEAEDHDET